MIKSVKIKRISVFNRGRHSRKKDIILIEEPLEIFINGLQFAVIMRTPGDDVHLVTGLLYTEKIIKSADDIVKIIYCSKDLNSIEVVLKKRKHFIKRRMITTSSCGVCGRELIDDLMKSSIDLRKGSTVKFDKNIVLSLPNLMLANQTLFSQTGGSHSASLFSSDGRIILCKEDIGRHNAVDKIVGFALINDLLPLSTNILLVSGRISFEITQKALVSGISVICSISAASSLAIELAKRAGMTLIGMIRNNRFNVYCK
ncbi:MAG: formate dehydrogenase accessory sulfurtransferase FdhD [Planctomycetes bacterium]|nr:formate dehydrogenase accessory sulfurtransferase FdhD [Planctomycetota bacterium]